MIPPPPPPPPLSANGLSFLNIGPTYLRAAKSAIPPEATVAVAVVPTSAAEEGPPPPAVVLLFTTVGAMEGIMEGETTSIVMGKDVGMAVVGGM